MRLLTLDARSRDLAATIERHRPDVVCLHRAPSLLRWRSRCAALARHAGLVVVCGGRTAGGNLILSTLGVDVDATREVLFTANPVGPGAALAALRHREHAFVLAVAGEPHQGLTTARDELVPDARPAIEVIGAQVSADAPLVLNSDGAVHEVSAP